MIPWNSIIWREVAQTVFESDTLKYRKWLSVVWHSNRKNVRKELKLTDHLDKNEEDNTDAESDHDCLFNDMAEEINELDCCFEEIHPHEDFVEHEGDTRDVPDNTEQNKTKKASGDQQQQVKINSKFTSRVKTGEK